MKTLILTLALLLTGCVSTDNSNYYSVSVGDHYNDVIEKAGYPHDKRCLTSTKRVRCTLIYHGAFQERFYYTFDNSDYVTSIYR